MKIGDVNLGTDYGLLYSPATRNYGVRAIPRRVRALAIETVVEQRWNNQAFGGRRDVNARRVRVAFIDDPLLFESTGWRSEDKFLAAKKDSEMVVEARQLAGEWKDLRSDVALEMKRRTLETETRTKLETRLKALKISTDSVGISVTVDAQAKKVWFSFSLREREATRMLELAEKGAQT